METTFSSSEMNTSPLVSVCMITYNQSLYVSQAIEGVLMQQTNFPFELIVSDDCSVYGTREICQHYKGLHPNKIRLLLPNKNLGISENFYTTLFSAGGKYIAFCEGDDYWIDPCKLQKQVDYLESHPNVGCVYTDFNRLCQETGTFEYSLFHTDAKSFPLHSNLASFICHPLYLAPCTWLFRKELLVKPVFDSIDATFVLFSHMLSKTEIYFLPDTTSVYRNLPESASHSRSLKKLYRRIAGLYATQMELVKFYNLPLEMKSQIDDDYYSVHWRLIVAFGDKKAVTELHRVLKGKRLDCGQYIQLQISHCWIGRKINQKICKSYFRKYKHI